MSKKVENSNNTKNSDLTPHQEFICREKGTEQPFTGEYLYHKEDGTYLCVSCGNELFDSKTKYDSGSGWPSFYDIKKPDAIEKKLDDSLIFRPRTEVVCSRCDAHLGHVFEDGPEQTGLRYCINSASLKFSKK